ncbi:MAG TPA: TonB-dependent receptor [Vicinamibacterales bacterium]|nr:TonB-dependent receptor [Vicinamibacterales bacterium]
MVWPVPSSAQGIAAGNVSGQVKSVDGLGISGVIVTAESQALQGTRTATTSSAGDYIIPVLPTGDYTVTFTAAGFQAATELVRVAVAQPVALSIVLAVAPMTQSVTVNATNADDFRQTLTLSQSYKSGLVERLPLDRTLTGTVLLAPGVQATGPAGRLVVSGAVSYDSLFLIDGVVANDNQTGQPYSLFIEDAIQETAIATAGVSAEYGRFTGGVVNAITKSGGNAFSGSLRSTFTNDDWSALTPFPHDSRVDQTVPTYEATFGGPLVKDRLWFFGAARHADVKNAATTFLTNIPYVAENDENRYEGKITYTAASSQMFKAALTQIDLAQGNRSSGSFLDLASLSDRTNPQRLLSGNYTGVVSPRFFVEAQVSQRSFALVGSGAKTTDLLGGTILLDRQASNARYHAPSSCGVCTNEQRDNFDASGKGTYFLSTSGTGSHDITTGGEIYNDRRVDNEFPSASNFQIFGTSIIAQSDAIYPVFNSDGTTFIRWSPIFTPTQGTNFRTYSGFANDLWRLNDRLTVNAGVRYDRHGGTDSVGHHVVGDSSLSPRLAASWRIPGADAWTLNASAARYVGDMLVTVADSSSAGGRAATFDYAYLGPAVNVNPSDPLMTQTQAIQTVFNWFNANGGTNRLTRGAPTVPGLTTVLSPDLGAPSVVEGTVGVARGFANRGSVRLDGVYRTFGNFYSDRVDLSTGSVSNSIGQLFDLDVLGNSSALERRFRGVIAQASYRLSDRIDLAGNYSLSETYGNYDGEAFPAGAEANASAQLYPEYTDARWNRPVGDLSIDQRHRFRGWTVYRVPVPDRIGTFSVSILEGVESGTPYGATGLVDTRPFVANPGYVNPPASENYYFTARDAFRTQAVSHTDLSLNLAHTTSTVARTEWFIRGTVLNVFNQQGISNAAAVDQSVLTSSNSSRFQSFNPFTTNPVQGVNWDFGPSFGRPTTRLAYQLPRTLSFSVGVKF